MERTTSHLWEHCVVANRLFSRAKGRTLRLALQPKSGRQNAQLIALRALSLSQQDPITHVDRKQAVNA